MCLKTCQFMYHYWSGGWWRIFWISGSQSIKWEKAASESSSNILEMQIIQLHCRFSESETVGGPIWVLTGPLFSLAPWYSSVAWKPTTSESHGNLLDQQNLGSIPVLLIQNLHFNRIPKLSACTYVLEKHYFTNLTNVWGEYFTISACVTR